MPACEPSAEPEVLLPDGQRVSAAIFALVLDLIRHGHTISIDADGGPVVILPPCHPDVATILDLSWHATVAVLDDLAEPHTIH